MPPKTKNSKPKRKSKSNSLGSDLGLLNGRSQMVVSAMYYSNMDDSSRSGAQVYFRDYRKNVGIGSMMDYLSECLDTQSEDDDGRKVDVKLLYSIEMFLRSEIERLFPGTKIPKDFGKWRKRHQKELASVVRSAGAAGLS